MHEDYYGFTEKPFNFAPDPKYLYNSHSHANAVDLLQYAVRRRDGFVVITGGTGTGKTTLCRSVGRQLDRKTFTSLVVDPLLSEDDLLRLMLRDFGIVSRYAIPRGRLARVSRDEMIHTLNRFLLSLRPLRAGALLVVDDAQNLRQQVFEQIRMLSSLEYENDKLLQIALVGQPKLNELLRTELQHLDRCVSFRYDLTPLTQEETAAYAAHRLAIAGPGSTVSFAPKALALVHRYTAGVPRLINLVCERGLLAGYLAGSDRVTTDMIRTAAAGLGLAKQDAQLFGWVRRNFAPLAAGAALMASVSAAASYGVTALQARPAPASTQREAPAPLLLNGLSLLRPRSEPTPVAETQAPQHPAPAPPEAGPSTGTMGSAPETASPQYSVLVASFRQQAEAAALSGQLEGLGYRVRTLRAGSVQSGIWHQVMVGPYAGPDEARQNEARVRRLPGYADAYLVTR